jgi:uncharacterized repeat protein (TIGR02543 family)
MNMLCSPDFKLYGDAAGDSGLSVVKKGMLTNYPWELPDNLTVPASHTTNQFAMGDIWMTYNTNNRGETPQITEYGGKHGTNNFYLMTWNNTAMIQTGHSNGDATEDEQKVLANTFLYLSQISTDTSFDDHTAQDLAAPDAVAGGVRLGAGSRVIRFNEPNDNGSSYDYYIEAIDSEGNKAASETTSATVTTGVAGYAVTIDTNPTGDPGEDVITPSPVFGVSGLAPGTYYAHIRAIDGAGNASETADFQFTVVPGAPVAGSGRALNFDGVDDYVDIPANTAYDTPEFTVETWVKYSDNQSFGGIIDKGRNVRKNWYIVTEEGAKRGVRVGMGSGNELNYNWADNGWHHVCITFDGGTFKLYVDGIVRSTKAVSSYTPSGESVAFGRRQQPSEGGGNLYPYKGLADEVRIWNTARTQQQINDNMYKILSGSEPGLVGCWRMDEPDGSTVYDTSGHQDGTLTNADAATCRVSSDAWGLRSAVKNMPLTIDAGYDPEGGELTITQTAAPSHGSLSFDNPNKKLTYTPNTGWIGTDTFTYTVTNSAELADAYTVNVATNSIPVAGFGKALEFDGTNFVEIPNNASHNILNKFTIELWFKSADTSQTYKYLISRNGINIQKQWAVLYEYKDNKVEFHAPETDEDADEDNNPKDYSAMTIADTDWHHIAYAYDGTTWSSYLDGMLINSKQLSFAFGSYNNNLYIGGTSGNVNLVKGSIDEVRIWKTGLSGDTIRSWMYREVDPTHPDYVYLADYYKLNEGAGTATADETGSANGQSKYYLSGRYPAWVDSGIRSWSTNEDATLHGKLVGSCESGSSNNHLDWKLAFAVTAQGAKGTASIDEGNDFTYVPNADEYGVDTFSYKVYNGPYSSNEYIVHVTINSVNDAPAFTKGPDQTASGNADARTVAGWASGISAGAANEAGQALDFIVTNNNNSLFNVQPAVLPNGTLTYTPKLNVSGTATVFVQLHDNGGTANGGVNISAVRQFTITVNTLQSYTLTFDSAEGSPVGQITQIYGSSVAKPGDPVKAGYTFAGWWTGENGTGTEISWPYVLTGNATFHAKWTAKDISLPPAALPAGTYGTSYSGTITAASEGTGAYTYSITGGALPPGLLLSGTTISGTPLSAGTYGFTITAVDNVSGKAASQTYSIAIGKRAITVKADDKSKVYGAVDPALTYTVISGSLAGGDAFAGTLAREPGEDAGDYEISQGTLALSGNYNLSFTPGTFRINKADVTGITFEDGSYTYDGTVKSLSIGGVLPAGVTVAYEGNGKKDAGIYTVTAKFTVDGNYNAISDKTATLTINRRNVTVRAEDKSKVYGAVDPALTYTIDAGSLAGGDAFAGTLAREPGEDAGDYEIGQGTLALSSNYNLSFTPGTFRINKADVTGITFGDGSYTYDGTVKSLSIGGVLPVGVTVAYEGNGKKDAGIYTVTAKFTVNGNYNAIGDKTATLTINRRDISVRAEDKSKVYGTADPALTYTVILGSLAAGDAFTGAIAREPGEDAGDYEIGQGTLALSSNYNLSFTPGTFRINKADVTGITFEDRSYTYDGTVKSLSISGTLPAGVTVAYEGNGKKDAGIYTVTAKFTVNGNYNAIGDKTAVLTINRRDMSVCAEDKSKTYGAVDPALTYTLAAGSLAAGDAFAGALAREPGEDVGDYEISQGTLALSGNYNLSFTPGTFRINKADVIGITFEDENYTYDGTVKSLSISGTLPAGVTVAYEGNGKRDAGVYTVTAKFTVNENYNAIGDKTAVLTINRRDISVRADDKSKVYGTADPALTYIVILGSLAAGDAFTGALAREPGENAGDYRIDQGTLALNDNYNLIFLPGKLTISKAPLTATADDKTKVYGDANPRFTITYRGFLNGDNVSDITEPSVSTTATVNSPPGVYGIILAGGTAANYDFILENGILRITPMPSAPSIDTDTDIFINGKAQNIGVTTIRVESGRTVATVTIDGQKLEGSLEAQGSGTVVTIPVAARTDTAIGELNGQTVKNLEAGQAVVEIKTEMATYTLPAAQIDISGVSSQLGENVALKDIKVQIVISSPAEETVKLVEDMRNKGEYAIVVPPVEFSVKCTYGEKTVEVGSFNAYVERMIPLPDGDDSRKVTTGIIVDPDGAVRHVPTKIIVIDGKYYAQINSLTNSAYTVIWNPREYRDAVGHWAEDALDDMGSRLIITDADYDMVFPDHLLTRAEFIAIIIRALGLKPKPEKGRNLFTDVDAYTGYVEAGREYGIIFGYGNGNYGLEDKITREQAASIIARAMKITGLEAELENGEAKNLLYAFDDQEHSATWARDYLAACVKTGILSGGTSKNGDRLLTPKDNLTRAEAAVLVQKLLQKSGLI